MKLIKKFLDIVFPRLCEICGKCLSFEELLVCKDCEVKLPYLRSYCKRCGFPLPETMIENYGKEINYCFYCISHNFYFDRVEAVFYYKEPVSLWINQIKFSNNFVLAYDLGRFIRKRIFLDLSEYDLIVAVPLSKERLRKRGFNQSFLLGWGLLGKRPNHNILTRVKDTHPQTKLNQKERWKNVKDAFKLSTTQLKAQKVLIIDDVMTTGATLNEVAKVLKEGGVKKIDILVVARSQLE